MLSGTDGFTICRDIRKNSICPIIFLTARGREEDILYGYNLGCDDYVVKPFSLAELFAKVNAVIKRAKGMVGTTLLTRLWGYDYEGNERVVDNHVKKLRKALGSAGGQIKTVITRGYKMEEVRIL